MTRVGAAEKAAIERLGVRVIDASGAGWGIINHDLFLSNTEVLKVIRPLDRYRGRVNCRLCGNSMAPAVTSKSRRRNITTPAQLSSFRVSQNQRRTVMKSITLEEHFATPAFLKRLRRKGFCSARRGALA
jgi:hypothetical protein